MTAYSKTASAPSPTRAPASVAQSTQNGTRITRIVPAPRKPVFWMAYWMAVSFAVIKGFHFGMPPSAHPAKLLDYAWELIVGTAADNCLALAVGIVATLTLASLVRLPRLQRWAWRGWIALAVFFVLYAIVDAYVFSFARTPITLRLIKASGSWGDIKSSLAPFYTRSTEVALLGGPGAYLLLVWLTHRYVGVPRAGALGVIVALLATAVLGQFAYAQTVQPQWTRRVDHRIALNPHWALFSSCVLKQPELQLNLPKDIPPAMEADFVPTRERSAARSYELPFTGRPKHIIVYVLESTSTQFLHVCGSRFHTTPNLDAETSHMLSFDSIYSEVGMTPSALVGITTSDYARTIWQSNNCYRDDNPLYQPGTLISEVLKARGFRTLALTASNLKFSYQRQFMQGRGFDEIYDKRDLPGPELMSWGKPDELMIDKLLEWVDKDPAHATPFFALCWTNQTHHPYLLQEGVEEKNLLGDFVPPPPAHPPTINRYLNVLLEEDRQLGRLFAALRQRGLADDTLVLITGDHGEGFNFPHQSLGHGFRLYEENLHVPCILWNPRLFKQPERLPAVGGHIDLAPTITDMLGLPPAPTWQGHSLFDPARPNRAYYYGAFDDYLLGVRDGDWKYTYNATTGYDELYNIRLDPSEANDVMSTHPEICIDLRRRVGAWANYHEKHGAGVK